MPPIPDSSVFTRWRRECELTRKLMPSGRFEFPVDMSCWWSGSESKTLADMRFLFSQDEWLPTWWTTMPQKLPIITGWAPSRCAEKLSGRPEDFVAEQAVQSLSRLLNVRKGEIESLLESVYWHDWQSDPLSRGAYSYVKLGGDAAQQQLAAPVENTLFFAGEVTDFTGHHGTVHGAIASGHRAAAEILKA